MLASFLKLLRPKQWSKNLLVFAALLFTGDFRNQALVTHAFIAFAAMCLVSSSIYILNDLLDVERDRAHPVKKNRPIASGKVPVGVALVLSTVCVGSGIALGLSLNVTSVAIIGGYLLLQAAYNLGLKRVPLADVFLIASGFVLRAILGATAIQEAISGWLLFCTGALALLLGFGKRRHEFMLQGTDRAKSRESLSGYNLEVLNAYVIMCSVSAAQSYAVYSVQSSTAQKHPGLVFSSILVFYGVFRYVLLVFKSDEGGEPENLLFRDPHILITMVLFTIVSGLAVSGLSLGLLEQTVKP